MLHSIRAQGEVSILPPASDADLVPDCSEPCVAGTTVLGLQLSQNVIFHPESANMVSILNVMTSIYRQLVKYTTQGRG